MPEIRSSASIVVHNGLYRALRAITPLRRMVRTVRRWIGDRRVPVWLLEGRERNGREPLRIAFAGQLENMAYISELAYGDSTVAVAQGWQWIKNVSSWARRRAGDDGLVVIDVDERWRHLFAWQRCFWLPIWLGGEIDVDAVIARMQHSRNAKEDLRRFRNRGIAWEITTSVEAFEHFYTTMHVPYVKNVFGDRAWVETYEEVLQRMPQCELLLAIQRGEPIAGQVIEYYKPGHAAEWFLGVKNGDRSYVQLGVIKALDYFTALHLAQRGYKKCHLGGTRPFLHDSVLHRKARRRGMCVTDHWKKGFALSFSRLSPGIAAFLMHNPFVYESAGAYRGAVFISAEPPPRSDTIRDLFNQHYIEGMSGLDIFLFGNSSVAVDLPPDLRAKVCLRHIDE
ncbi:MAG: GNAT family N-acetyltransferase [Sulfuricaulis sp.]|nr:GNAT family N-acetyltransferase [Sulfuricaulis sp.]